MTEREEAIKILIIYASEDKLFLKQLEKQLAMLKRRSLVIWHDIDITAGSEWQQFIKHDEIKTADIILLFVSSDFLASNFSFSHEMKEILDRHEARQARVIPILVRPADWKVAPFANLQVLPRNAKPVKSWLDSDEAFFDITRSIRSIVEEISASRRPSEAKEQDLPYQKSLGHYQLYEVFVKSGVPTITFVEREDFETLKLSLAHPGRGVVIEGPSGVGKTTAIEKATEQLVSSKLMPPTNTPVQLLSARHPSHIVKLQTLHQWHKGTVIVDDFHRLDPPLRQALTDYMKYLADTTAKEQKLVIVGIPQTHQTLVDIAPDLAMRIDVFELGKVDDKLISEMIEKGEKALNVKLEEPSKVVLAANGSLNIAQFLCFDICQRKKITQTQDQLRGIPSDTEEAIPSVLSHLSWKFSKLTKYFAALGPQNDTTSLVILEELANSEDGSVSFPMLKIEKPQLAHDIQRFMNEKWMDALYNEYPQAANDLYFDNFAKALVIEDPQLLFYLRNKSLSTIAKEVGKIPALTKRKVFISYSHKDDSWLKRLQTHLKPLENEGIIDRWDDTKLIPGMLWKEAIQKALETARVGIVLISADFLASDFIIKYELPTLLTQAESGGTTIIPIIISPSTFKHSPLKNFQTVNPPSKPLLGMSDVKQEETLVKVAETIWEIITGTGT